MLTGLPPSLTPDGYYVLSSGVVMKYLEASGLLPYLEQLGFNLVGFGCTTCIGNSGDLPAEINQAIEKNDIVAAAVLSGECTMHTYPLMALA